MLSLVESALSTSEENETNDLEIITEMLVMFCDCEANCHQEFVPPDQTVILHY